PTQDIKMDEIAAMARRHQPGLIMADRCVGGVNENFVTPEQEIPEQPLGIPWESCITLGNKWKYVPDDVYKLAGQVVKMLVETVAKGGNLLLGVGPSPLGEIPAGVENRLREVGAWLKVNGEAIYSTRPIAPFQEGSVRFTKKDNIIYAIILPDENGNMPDKISITSFTPVEGSQLELLGYGRDIKYRRLSEGFEVCLPEGLPDSYATVVKFVPAGFF
ncbi:MAG: alpha-L-fucosidase, partial [Lentisphaerae bacterium]|nr:alpha-L-fucosidase [Lentisphaerota bacterium]